MNNLGSICIFCGSSMGNDPQFKTAAIAVGHELGHRRMGLVYGGGSVGLMGAVAKAGQEAGSSVVGVIPESLTSHEMMGEQIGEQIIVETMHERKAIMASLADAFIVLPGGFGTLDELFEMVIWEQLGLHDKPVGLLNIGGYYDAMLEWVDSSIASGFIQAAHRDLLVTETEPAALIDLLEGHRPPPGLGHWLSVDEA